MKGIGLRKEKEGASGESDIEWKRRGVCCEDRTGKTHKARALDCDGKTRVHAQEGDVARIRLGRSNAHAKEGYVARIGLGRTQSREEYLGRP